MNRGLAEEMNAALWLILAAIIVGFHGWGVVSVLLTAYGIFGLGCAGYFYIKEIKEKGE